VTNPEVGWGSCRCWFCAPIKEADPSHSELIQHPGPHIGSGGEEYTKIPSPCWSWALQAHFHGMLPQRRSAQLPPDDRHFPGPGEDRHDVDHVGPPAKEVR